MSKESSQTTTDHDKIRNWVEERNGKPTQVKRTGSKDDPGVLRIDFDYGDPDTELEEVSWEKFFETFEDSNLAFLYQDKTSDGKQSRFFKFVSRDSSK
jgi:hypothetical protein